MKTLTGVLFLIGTIITVVSQMPAEPCPKISCLKPCPGGYKTDMMGCKLCDCKPTPKPETQPMDRPIMIVPVMCPVPKCTNKCPDGFERDSRGCQTCNCKYLNIPCPPGVMKVNCPMLPCSVRKCPIFPMAKCVQSLCGGCYAAFYVNGIKVTC